MWEYSPIDEFTLGGDALFSNFDSVNNICSRHPCPAFFDLFSRAQAKRNQIKAADPVPRPKTRGIAHQYRWEENTYTHTGTLINDQNCLLIFQNGPACSLVERAQCNDRLMFGIIQHLDLVFAERDVRASTIFDSPLCRPFSPIKKRTRQP